MTMAVHVDNLMMQKMMTRKNELGNMIHAGPDGGQTRPQP